MKQRIFSHFQDYLIQYISHQYQDLLYYKNKNKKTVTLLNIITEMILNLKRLDDYDRLTDWIRPLARGLATNSLTDR
jgi:hypothetical protein